MRLHFISRLALLIAGGFLLVSTQESIWAGNTLKWLFVVGGAVAIAVAAIDAVRENQTQRAVDFVTAVLGAWAIVEVLTLSSGDVKWWSFATAAAIAAVSTLGLIAHETSTERVVHELLVTSDSTQRVPSAS